MRRILPLLALLMLIAVFFRKTLIYGLIPIPFDLLVAWFFPYNSGGWFAGWTIYKGGNFASDAIRELYPWKHLVIDLMKNGDLPLWNPYAFSGTPLLANMQSSVFYPMNIVFLLTKDFPFAWAAYIASAVLLAGAFMFLFLRSLRLKGPAALLGSVAFAFSGYMIVWMEWGSVAHQLVWLPLSLFALTKWWETENKRFLLLLLVSAASTILAGYPQGAAYNFLIVAAWFTALLLKTNPGQKARKAWPALACAVLVVGITAVQWLPTSELYFNSAMRGEVSRKLGREAALPFIQFSSVLVPDYFGNRVMDDYWAKSAFSGVDYMDADLYVGVTVVLLAVLAMLNREKRREVRWLIGLLIVGVLLAAKSPISALIAELGIPVISTGAAAEAALISIFALCCLGAFGLDMVKSKAMLSGSRWAIVFVGAALTILFMGTGLLDPQKANIARDAMRVPVAAFVLASAFIAMASAKRSGTAVVMIVVVLAAELLGHANKILPFSPSSFAFPDHVLIGELQRRSGYDRVVGFWESEIATNFHTEFRLYSAEGYDPLYIRRYGEFMTSAEEGKLPTSVPRSDADFTMRNETNRNRLIDLTSVKYIYSKVTDPGERWEQEPLKFDPQRFKLVWQEGQFKIYENLSALPRAKLFYDWQLVSDDERIIEAIYKGKFDPHRQVLLEEDPGIEPASENSTPGVSVSVSEPKHHRGDTQLNTTNKSGSSDGEKGNAAIKSYQPTEIKIQTESDRPAVLMLTDSFYPGWKASVDGRPTGILRANYTFRGIVVPAGSHTVSFSYTPVSLRIGALMTLLSVFLVPVAWVAWGNVLSFNRRK